MVLFLNLFIYGIMQNTISNQWLNCSHLTSKFVKYIRVEYNIGNGKDIQTPDDNHGT